MGHDPIKKKVRRRTHFPSYERVDSEDVADAQRPKTSPTHNDVRFRLALRAGGLAGVGRETRGFSEWTACFWPKQLGLFHVPEDPDAFYLGKKRHVET